MVEDDISLPLVIFLNAFIYTTSTEKWLKLHLLLPEYLNMGI